MNLTDDELSALLAASDIGVYPRAVSGHETQSYTERDGFKNGWNACVLNYCQAIQRALISAKSFNHIDKMFSQCDYLYYVDEDEERGWQVSLNDTWHFGCSDAEEVKDSEKLSLYRLVDRYGYCGALFWVYTKRGYHSEFKDIQLICETVEHLEKEKFATDKNQRTGDQI